MNVKTIVLGAGEGPFSGRATWAIAAGALFVLVLSGILFVAMAPRHAVLFSDLRERDLVHISEELRKKKVDFRIGNDGHSVLVPESDVHRVRMQLMAQDLSLQGNVGFELFNGADLGMTEFVQKVNYQRALQGELARTIESMGEVQSARVHLAMPDQGLFKKAPARNKASVTLTLKPGVEFSRAQTHGVQRLVAASVPDIAPDDVAVLDQRGTVLNGAKDGDDSLGDGWMDRKRSTETYLGRKAAQVLDRMFGEGASLVSVDVQLNEERRSSTIEEVVPAYAPKNQAPAGIVTRERQSTRGAGVESPGIAAAGKGQEASVVEFEYQVGKKVDHVQTPAGGVRRINVAVVLKLPLGDVDTQRVKELVGAAVGANAGRGDTVAVTTLQQAVHGAPASLAGPATRAALDTPAAVNSGPYPAGEHARPQETTVSVLLLLAGLAAVMLVATLAARLWRPGRQAPPALALAGAEREAMLANLRNWLAHDTPREAP